MSVASELEIVGCSYACYVRSVSLVEAARYIYHLCSTYYTPSPRAHFCLYSALNCNVFASTLTVTSAIKDMKTF